MRCIIFQSSGKPGEQHLESSLEGAASAVSASAATSTAAGEPATRAGARGNHGERGIQAEAIDVAGAGVP